MAIIIAVTLSFASQGHVKFRVRHTGIRDENGQPRCGSGCSCPLGICFSSSVVMEPGTLSQAEIADGWGTGDVSVYGPVNTIYLDPPINKIAVSGGYIKIELHQQTALPDGSIPIEGDFFVDPLVASSLGYNSIKVKAGTYFVQGSQVSNYGAVIVQCVFNLKGEKQVPHL